MKWRPPAPDADCNPRYGANARIPLTMTDADGVEMLTATAPGAESALTLQRSSCVIPMNPLTITR